MSKTFCKYCECFKEAESVRLGGCHLTPTTIFKAPDDFCFQGIPKKEVSSELTSDQEGNWSHFLSYEAPRFARDIANIPAITIPIEDKNIKEK